MATFNKNMLAPGGFTFSIKKLPEFNDFVQSVSVPGIQTSAAERPTPFIAIPETGDHATFGDLSVNFKINEDLGNYIEIFNWIVGITFPNEYSEYRNLANNALTTGEGVKVDGNLIVLNSAKNPVIRVDFLDMYPIGLSGLDFTTQDTEIDYMEATASFRFRTYKFTSV